MSDPDPRSPQRNGDAERPAGRYAYDGLDRILHEKARLGIMTSLLTHPEGLLFNDLKEMCSLTDGNLSRHLGVLHDAGLVELWKGFGDRRPQTLCRLSREGRRRFLEYVSILGKVIEDAQRAEALQSERSRRELPPGWIPA